MMNTGNMRKYSFPDPRSAGEEGLIAVGGDLKPGRILSAYQQGIFPWFSEGEPIMWWSPDPRMVLYPGNLKVSRSLQQTLNSKRYQITYNQAFEKVITHCARTERPDQEGTWITQSMMSAYARLHTLGYAHSVEAWEGDVLVGGLYGIDLGDIFCGESMFHLRKDASKCAFVSLVHRLRERHYRCIDCQLPTDHLKSLGAEEIPREVFLSYLTPPHC